MGTTATEHLRTLTPEQRPGIPETMAGTLRLDVYEDGWTEHWYLTVADQHIEVSRSADDADLVVRAHRSVFDRLAAGEVRASAAMLRNDLTVQGDMRLFVVFRRVFPGPPGARHPREAARQAAAESAAAQEARP
ncbi:SCP2 sterol-binding domain-containing protein [Micromonospora sp. 15K316]|uniref:SCP2 sterol-binding domain-containing protein n=1 Tax=Micromonospora sp. 15K316 TaxID=2530376 RepID=UPI00104FA851|nr:SCP2 sterol-binding domain-containing protein [Micromonospora sp. 15K316]TDC37617.1 SCP2 sterol-binding domain-containing protein [Micromonospora sp. 15K316]